MSGENIKQKILERAKNNVLKIKVLPNSSKQEIIFDDIIKIKLNSIPEKGRANKELVKMFKKEFDIKIEIIKGRNSREKLIRIF